jgi:hypothetical protein
MTKTTVTAALAAILLSGPALSDDRPEHIRAQLLATPVWTFEWARPDKVHSGKAWFAEKDGKLIGYIDTGMKCDNEVTLRTDGFDMDTCYHGGDMRFVRSGDEFKSTASGYTYTIRPARD